MFRRTGTGFLLATAMFFAHPAMAENTCGFTPDKTIDISGGTFNNGYRWESERIKNKDRVAFVNFRVVKGKVKIWVKYHRAGWRNGMEKVVGPTEASQDHCWRNPHHNTPDVMCGFEVLEKDTEITTAKVEMKND